MSDVATQARSLAAVCGDALVGSVLRRLAEIELGRIDLAIERVRKELAPSSLAATGEPGNMGSMAKR